MTMLCASSHGAVDDRLDADRDALVCSMKPILLRSVPLGMGTRTAAAASNELVWMAGMRSTEKNARMTWRIVSVPSQRG